MYTNDNEDMLPPFSDPDTGGDTRSRWAGRVAKYTDGTVYNTNQDISSWGGIRSHNQLGIWGCPAGISYWRDEDASNAKDWNPGMRFTHQYAVTGFQHHDPAFYDDPAPNNAGFVQASANGLPLWDNSGQFESWKFSQAANSVLVLDGFYNPNGWAHQHPLTVEFWDAGVPAGPMRLGNNQHDSGGNLLFAGMHAGYMKKYRYMQGWGDRTAYIPVPGEYRNGEHQWVPAE